MRRKSDVVSATEIAAWVYCAESWRLQHGLGLPPGNDAGRRAGVRHHARKAVAERLAGFAILLGRVLIALGAILVLLLLWWLR